VRVLIIGGTGFIGPDVLARLNEMGDQIFLFHRGQTNIDLPRAVEQILGDRKDLANFVDLFKRLAPDVVLDMFPFGEQDARSVTQTFKGITPRVIAISSQDVYRAYGRLRRTEPGPIDPVPLTEAAPLRQKLYPYRSDTPRSEQDPMRWLDNYDKIVVEQIVMGDPDLPGTILRLPMVYGPRDNQHRLFEYLKRMDDNRPAILLDEGLANWRWTRGYVENVAAAISLAVRDERAVSRIYNVGESETISTAEWVSKIGQLAGWYGKIIAVPGTYLPTHLAVDIDTEQHLVADTSRIRQELHYAEPVPLDEALARTITWERMHPPKEIDPNLFDYAAEDRALAQLE
jgi:nucleoside-diphosphate-sugar epimerase